MRTRHSLTAAVVAILVILVGVIISLLAGGRPNAHAEEPGAAPSVVTPAPPPDPGTPAGQRHHPNTHRKKTTASPTRTRTRATVSAPTTAPTRTGPTVSAPKPPRLGTASVPADALFVPTDDGQAFSVGYSSLESGPGTGRLSRTQTFTIPITGDAGDTTLALALQGYVITDDDTTATLTVTVNGAATTRVYHSGADQEIVERADLPLHGVRQCRVTVRVEVDGADGYLNASSVDGEIRRARQ